MRQLPVTGLVAIYTVKDKLLICSKGSKSTEKKETGSSTSEKTTVWIVPAGVTERFEISSHDSGRSKEGNGFGFSCWFREMDESFGLRSEVFNFP